MAKPGPGAIERPKHVDPNDPRRFSIVSDSTKAFTRIVDGVEQKFIGGTASSNVKDRQGDILDAQCQASMLTQAKGLVTWLNHEYVVPEDVLGTCVAASLHTRAADSGEVVDLDIETMVDEENPRALKSWKHIFNGTKLAWSIGGIFKDFDIVEPEDDDDFWSWLFPDLIVHDLELLEISLVGIPANPRAYTKSQALKSQSVWNMTRGLHDAIEPLVKRIGKSALKDATIRLALKKSLLGDPEARRMLSAMPESHEAEVSTETAPPTRVDPALAVAEAVADVRDADPQVAEVLAPADVPADAPLAAPAVVESPTTTPGTETSPVVPSVASAPAADAAAATDDAAAITALGDAAAHAESVPLAAPASDAIAVDLAAPAEVVPVAAVATDATTSPAHALAAPVAVTKDADPDNDGDNDAAADASLAILEEPKQKRVVKAMRAIKRGIAHGLCTDSMQHAVKAHKAMKSLLPTDYDLPSDAALGGDDDDDETRSAASAIGKSVEPTADERRAGETLQRETTDLEAKKADLLRETADLQQKLDNLRDTPVGRRSVANPGGIHTEDESASLVPKTAWTLSNHDLAREAGKRMATTSMRASSARDNAV